VDVVWLVCRGSSKTQRVLFRRQPKLPSRASLVLSLASIDEATVYGGIGFSTPLHPLMRCAQCIWILRVSTVTPLLVSAHLRADLPWAAPQRRVHASDLWSCCHGLHVFASCRPCVDLRHIHGEVSAEIAPPVRFAPLWRHLLLESGIPEVSTLSIFRPWAFSTLRRFSPPTS